MSYPTPLLLVNGVVHTFVDGEPPGEALAIDRASGRIIAAGREGDVREALGAFAKVETIDLRGRVVIPGMIDAHTHLLGAAEDVVDVDLGGARDEMAAAERIGLRAASTTKGQWIRGRHWNQQFWPERRFPTRASLDRVAPNHPVMAWSHSQHVLWVNSIALARAGITRDTPDPAGGRIGRDDSGEPDGMLFEYSAIERIDAAFEAESAVDERELDALRRVLRGMSARGLTAVQTMEGARSLGLMLRLRERGELPLRVGYFLRLSQLDAVRALGLQAGFGDDWLRIDGVKFFADGALGTHTAAMLQPFDDDPQNLGLLTTTPERLTAGVSDTARARLNVAIHAIGDRAVRVALDAIEHAQRIGATERAMRFRIEHVQLADPADIVRMAQMGVIASIQPFHAVSDRDVAERSWGARAADSYAYNTLANAGVRLALGSDVPIETADPWRILHAAIARNDDLTPDRPAWHPREALTPARALWAYTAGAAWAGGHEKRLGRLAPGMLGDCVVLAADPLRIETRALPAIPVEVVIIGGQVVTGVSQR